MRKLVKPLKRRRTETLKITYQGTTYRSSWEVYTAKLLFYSNIEFSFEPKRFFFSNKLSYLPDFYIPSMKAFIEVKGYLSDKDKAKISMFRATQKYDLIYLGSEELSYIYGKPAGHISKIDFGKYVPSKEELFRFQRFIKTRK